MVGPYSPTLDLPPARVTVARTALVIEHVDALRPLTPSGRPRAALRAITPCPVPTWRALYRDVGRVWGWVDRDAWSDERLAAHLDSGQVRIFAVDTDIAGLAHHAVGFLELHRHDDGAVEIAYLGLMPAAMGVGLGAWLVDAAVREAFAWGATHAWLTTCSLDAPHALANYLRRGFRPWRFDVYDAPGPPERPPERPSPRP
ncbi:MAG: GNAT family N-acetyltransferase [Gemmatimonadetes bacterium]|nr:GNAT family N-acetyltransferase [Gemmatimonadota bacterium]